MGMLAALALWGYFSTEGVYQIRQDHGWQSVCVLTTFHSVANPFTYPRISPSLQKYPSNKYELSPYF